MGPTKRRGKEREKPKKKKPTKMKKLILLSRTEKKMIRESNKAVLLQNQGIQFKQEQNQATKSPIESCYEQVAQVEPKFEDKFEVIDNETSLKELKVITMSKSCNDEVP